MNDFINGLFEAVGAYIAWRNAYQLYADKIVRGIYTPAFAFWAAWGMWNVYYYPSLEQWWSFSWGCILTAGNISWVILFLRYK